MYMGHVKMINLELRSDHQGLRAHTTLHPTKHNILIRI